MVLNISLIILQTVVPKYLHSTSLVMMSKRVTVFLGLRSVGFRVRVIRVSTILVQVKAIRVD